MRRSLSTLHARSVLLLGALASLPACKEEAPPPAAPIEVGVVDVVQKDVPVVVEMIGQTFGSSDVEIRTRVPGWIRGMHFQEGSEVKKGTLLYTIDSSELQEAVSHAQGQLAAAQTRLALADNDVKRYTPLAAMNAVSKRDLDEANARQGAARGEVQAAEASLQVARINLGYARVVAPIDGLIGLSQVKVGDYVGLAAPSGLLNTISAVDPIHVRFSISEREYLDLARKFGTSRDAAPRQIELKLRLADGSTYPHPGAINFANRQVDSTTGALIIEAAFPNPQKLLRPGQFARVSGVTEVKKGALLVPQRTVQELQGQYFVYVVGGDGKVANKPVKPGIRVGSLWQIDEGLKPGDKVVIEGLQRVRPGAEVVTRTVAPEAADAGPGAGAGSSASEPAGGAKASPSPAGASGH